MLLLASYSGALGGAERLLIDWASALEDEVRLTCPEGALAEAARAAGLRVIPLRRRSLVVRASAQDRFLSPARIVGHGRELRRLVTAAEPELLVLWGMRSALAWLLVSWRPGPRIVFQHNDFLPGPVIGAAVRRAAAHADLVIALSDAVARDLDPGGKLASRVEVVHPGVDPARFEPDAPPAAPARVLLLGALVGWKRPDVALEAIALARRRLPDVRLRVVGEPLESDLIDALRARAEAPDLRGAVDFAGAVADPARELAAATCLLHCAEREPFGLVVLEAMAAGRPVVVPAGSGPAEIVDDACALRYPPGDVAAAARAVARVLDDPALAAAMGHAGRVRAQEHFDVTTSRTRWVHAVQRAMPAPRSVIAAPPLEIVTVTHNSAAVIGSLLSSVERHLPGARVTVVDNGSTDDTAARARESTVARVIELGQNVGFAAASNHGVGAVQAQITALLNPDVELLDDSLLELSAEAARRDRDERLLAPRVIASGGLIQDSVHPAPGSVPELLRPLIPFTVLPGRLVAPLAPWRSAAPRRVGWAVGCALLARTETLRALGPFDERMFLYGEDLELGLRAADAGVETWFWPSGRIVHHGAHATSVAFGGEAFELVALARRDALGRRRGARALAVDDAAQALTFATRIAAKRMLGRDDSRERRQLQALRAAR